MLTGAKPSFSKSKLTPTALACSTANSPLTVRTSFSLPVEKGGNFPVLAFPVITNRGNDGEAYAIDGPARCILDHPSQMIVTGIGIAGRRVRPGDKKGAATAGIIDCYQPKDGAGKQCAKSTLRADAKFHCVHRLPGTMPAGEWGVKHFPPLAPASGRVDPARCRG